MTQQDKIEFSDKYNSNAIAIPTDGRDPSGLGVQFFPPANVIKSMELVQRNTAQPFGIKINLDPAGDFEEYKGDYGVVMPDKDSPENPFMVLPYNTQESAREVMGIISQRMDENVVPQRKGTAPAYSM